jgi:hypothetical protein
MSSMSSLILRFTDGEGLLLCDGDLPMANIPMLECSGLWCRVDLYTLHVRLIIIRAL